MPFLDLLTVYDKLGNEAVSWYLNINRPLLDSIHVVSNAVFSLFLAVAMFLSVVFVLMSVIALLSRRRLSGYVFDESAPLSVSVQIPTFNELAALNCAKACLEFDYPKDKYEIIIGDDSDNSGVSQKIDVFAAEHQGIVKVTRRGNNAGFKPGNLNHMLKFSDGEVLVILDSDFLPEKDFLKHVVAPFQQNPLIGAVQARWKFVNQSQNLVSILGSVIGLAFHHIYLPFMKKLGGVSFLCGSAEAVRKAHVVRLGGWQHGSLTEDIEFSLRLLNDGHDIVYLEDYECWCEVPHVPKDLYRQQMRWAFGVVSAFLQHAITTIMNPRLGFRKKLSVQLQCMGYFFSTLLFCMFVAGTVSFFSNAPAPIDVPKFVGDMVQNIVFSSGIIISSLAALIKTRNHKIIWKALLSSFSYGLVVTYFVNIGIFKAIAGKNMTWFMLKKNGNVAAQ